MVEPTNRMTTHRMTTLRKRRFQGHPVRKRRSGYVRSSGAPNKGRILARHRQVVKSIKKKNLAKQHLKPLKNLSATYAEQARAQPKPESVKKDLVRKNLKQFIPAIPVLTKVKNSETTAPASAPSPQPSSLVRLDRSAKTDAQPQIGKNFYQSRFGMKENPYTNFFNQAVVDVVPAHASSAVVSAKNKRDLLIASAAGGVALAGGASYAAANTAAHNPKDDARFARQLVRGPLSFFRGAIRPTSLGSNYTLVNSLKGLGVVTNAGLVGYSYYQYQNALKRGDKAAVSEAQHALALNGAAFGKSLASGSKAFDAYRMYNFGQIGAKQVTGKLLSDVAAGVFVTAQGGVLLHQAESRYRRGEITSREKAAQAFSGVCRAGLGVACLVPGIDVAALPTATVLVGAETVATVARGGKHTDLIAGSYNYVGFHGVEKLTELGYSIGMNITRSVGASDARNATALQTVRRQRDYALKPLQNLQDGAFIKSAEIVYGAAEGISGLVNRDFGYNPRKRKPGEPISCTEGNQRNQNLPKSFPSVSSIQKPYEPAVAHQTLANRPTPSWRRDGFAASSHTLTRTNGNYFGRRTPAVFGTTASVQSSTAGATKRM